MMRGAGASTVFVLLAAFFWGLSGGIAGILTRDGWDPFVVSFYRGAIGLVCVLIWLVLQPKDSGLRNPWLWFWSVIAGLGVAGNFGFYFLSIAESGVSIAVALMYCAPVFVFLISFTLRLEKPTALKLAAIVLVVAGIALLTQIYDTDAMTVTPAGVGAGLLAGLSYAVFIFGFKYAAPHGSPQAVLSIALAVVVLTLIWPSDGEQLIAGLSTSAWPLFVVLGVFGAGLSFLLYIKGLRHTTPAVAAIVAMIEPVTAAGFGFVVLNESLTGIQVLGMVLIVGTVTALSTRTKAETGVTE